MEHEFLKWFNGKQRLPALTRAGLAHLYFVSIHPFEDGNGRIGRAVSEVALAQSLGRPSLIALTATIERKRNQYYEALERNNKELEVSNWLVRFGETDVEAQVRSIAMVEFLIAKARLYDRLAGKLNDRQQNVLAGMFREGPEGSKGGLRAGNYEYHWSNVIHCDPRYTGPGGERCVNAHRSMEAYAISSSA